MRSRGTKWHVITFVILKTLFITYNRTRYKPHQCACLIIYQITIIIVFILIIKYLFTHFTERKEKNILLYENLI